MGRLTFGQRKTAHRYTSDRYPSKVFVQTDFVRRNAPLFACAVMEPGRRIPLSWEERGLAIHEQVRIAQRLAKAHYIASGGHIEFWGTVQGYFFEYAEDQKPICISTTGQVIAEGDGLPKASFTIKGKDLNAVIPTIEP